MAKLVFYLFKGEAMCLAHGLLNALDLNEKGEEVKIVFEGQSTVLIPRLAEKENSFHGLFQQTREAGLIDAVCQACSHQMGVLQDIEGLGLPLTGDLKGHPAMSRYIKEGYSIITL